MFDLTNVNVGDSICIEVDGRYTIHCVETIEQRVMCRACPICRSESYQAIAGNSTRVTCSCGVEYQRMSPVEIVCRRSGIRINRETGEIVSGCGFAGFVGLLTPQLDAVVRRRELLSEADPRIQRVDFAACTEEQLSALAAVVMTLPRIQR